MRSVLTTVTLAVAAALGRAHAEQYEPRVVHDVDLLPNGHLLVTDGGTFQPPAPGGIYEIDRGGGVIWSYSAGLSFAHNADLQANGDVVISDTGNDRVLIVDSGGNVVWDSDSVALSDGSHLNYPNDANVLPSGNLLITDRDNHRVIEITLAGTIVWQHGQTGVPGGGPTRLNGPHNADRLANGNTIIADSNNQRVIEVTPGHTIAWIYNVGLNWPRDADRLANGNTLINDSNHHRVIEVTPEKTIVWTYTVDQISYDSDRLDDGHTLISNGGQIIEVTADGTLVWSYPQIVPPEEVWVLNPSTGVNLYCHIHRPRGFNPNRTYPGVVLVPGGSGAGTSFDANNRAQSFADLGFVAMHFDPDGRGESTNGGTYTYEDYCGYLQQDGLRAVLEYLADLPESDDRNIGVHSSSYGITMAAGTLARYAGAPAVKFLLDWEGPADRTDTAWPNGHVPHDPNDDAWWSEREPTNFIDDFGGYYLRVQSEIDHVQADNEHALKLLNGATHTQYGGLGRCYWTRINSESGDTNNPPNTVYTMQDPPEWLPESVPTDPLLRAYLGELALKPPLPLAGDMNCDGAADFGDINAFVAYVTDCEAWQSTYPQCPVENGDVDGDGLHACGGHLFDDVNAFVALLSGGG